MSNGLGAQVNEEDGVEYVAKSAEEVANRVGSVVVLGPCEECGATKFRIRQSTRWLECVDCENAYRIVPMS